MAILSFTQSLSKNAVAGVPQAMSLDTVALLALAAFSGDGYFSNLSNVNTIEFSWQHQTVDAGKTALFMNNGSNVFYVRDFLKFHAKSHEGSWLLKAIILHDYDGVAKVIKGSQLPNDLDITLGA
jgi:hypothetical protein